MSEPSFSTFALPIGSTKSSDISSAVSGKETPYINSFSRKQTTLGSRIAAYQTENRQSGGLSTVLPPKRSPVTTHLQQTPAVRRAPRRNDLQARNAAVPSRVILTVLSAHTSGGAVRSPEDDG